MRTSLALPVDKHTAGGQRTDMTQFARRSSPEGATRR